MISPRNDHAYDSNFEIAALGYGASCWSWQPTAWGWQRVWACGYGDGYGGWGWGGWGWGWGGWGWGGWGY
jgi:hypothetical protein